MNHAVKILVLLLVTSLMMANFAMATESMQQMSASPALPQSSQNVAGCHAHGGRMPHVPARSLPAAPTSHKCCLIGHDVALAQASHHTLSHHATRVGLQIGSALIERFFNVSDTSIVPTPDPSGITLLRI